MSVYAGRGGYGEPLGFHWGGREGGFNMQIPPSAFSASSHIIHSNMDMGRNKEDTQVNSTEQSQ